MIGLLLYSLFIFMEELLISLNIHWIVPQPGIKSVDVMNVNVVGTGKL
jgi:hypothetical protein